MQIASKIKRNVIYETIFFISLCSEVCIHFLYVFWIEIGCSKPPHVMWCAFPDRSGKDKARGSGGRRERDLQTLQTSKVADEFTRSQLCLWLARIADRSRPPPDGQQRR